MEWSQENFRITSGRDEIDREIVLDFLGQSYWAKDLPREIVDKSLDHSLCMNLFDGDRQIGFARVVTDYARMAYLADVFVLPEYRGRGLGRWLVACTLEHPEVVHIPKWSLGTKDARAFYESFGFKPTTGAIVLMERFAHDDDNDWD